LKIQNNLLVKLNSMSKEQTTDNKWKYIIAGGSLLVASLAGYYFWKTKETKEDKSILEEEPTTESEKETEKKNKIYLDDYSGKTYFTLKF
jgi:hypothetical protein